MKAVPLRRHASSRSLSKQSRARTEKAARPTRRFRSETGVALSNKRQDKRKRLHFVMVLFTILFLYPSTGGRERLIRQRWQL